MLAEETRRADEQIQQIINRGNDELDKRAFDRRRLGDFMKFSRLQAGADSVAEFDVVRNHVSAPLANVDWEPEVREARTYQVALETVRLGGTALTLGLVFYAVRAGGLVAAMLTALPAWSSIDPLVILHKDRKDKGAEWGNEDLTQIDEDEAGIGEILDVETSLDTAGFAHIDDYQSTRQASRES